MPRRSRKRSSLTHFRRLTTSSRMSAMWAAGPPKPMTPSLKKSAMTSRRGVAGGTRPRGHPPEDRGYIRGVKRGHRVWSALLVACALALGGLAEGIGPAPIPQVGGFLDAPRALFG